MLESTGLFTSKPLHTYERGQQMFMWDLFVYKDCSCDLRVGNL